MSQITITNLEVFFRVGVPDAERTQPQRLLITVELASDFSAAAASDRIDETIDYYQVAQRITALGDGHSWKLIEKLAADVADLVLKEFQPETVRVVIKKFPLPQAAEVSVSLTRARPGRQSK